MIEYKVNGVIVPDELEPFFQQWKSPPPMEVKKRFLSGSKLIITVRDSGKLIGFLTAISDGAMFACITLIEILEEYQGKGIGKRIMEFAVSYFKGFYDIILITDPEKGAFYKKFDFDEIYGMHLMDFTYGKSESE
jgi:GNAT superfamily N-acetyltransferase